MFLDQVIGYESIKGIFQQLLNEQKLGHAYLFVCPPGNGGLALTLNLSNYIVCLPEKKTSTDLDFAQIEHVPPFKRAHNFIHPDIHYIFPTVRKSEKIYLCKDFIESWRTFLKGNMYGTYFEWLQHIEAENKQGKITGEDCDNLLEILNLKPYESNYKVGIIWMPEMLGREGNKLLKLIEEPPPNTIFLLVTENQESVLSTIRSRCQKIHLPRYSMAEIEHGLIKIFNIEPPLAKRLSLFSQGDLSLALSFWKQPFTEELFLLKNWLNLIYINKQKELQEIVDEIYKLGREKQKHLMLYLLWLLELSIQQEIKSNAELFFSKEEEAFVNNINKLINPEHKVYFANYINKSHYYIERNANGKIMFMSLSIQLYYLLKKKEFISV